LKLPIHRFGDGVSIGPNLIATLVSFVFLMIAPMVFWEIIFTLVDSDAVDPRVIPNGLVETAGFAIGGSLLFLVIGVILQLWQDYQKIGSRWPVVLAFPVTAILLLPEAWARGDSVAFWIMVGVAVALAFSFHWLALVLASEALD
jgi:hypothetical protein